MSVVCDRDVRAATAAYSGGLTSGIFLHHIVVGHPATHTPKITKIAQRGR